MPAASLNLTTLNRNSSILSIEEHHFSMRSPAGGQQSSRINSKAIFARILKDRSLKEVKVSEQGMLKIEVQDDESKRTFGIEAMSSGEKGLILTCLIIAQTLDHGGDCSIG